MTALWLAFGISGWVFAVAMISVAAARARRRELQRALALRTHIRPYLQRRAFDASLEVPDAPDATVDAIARDLCQLVDRLVEHERGGVGGAATADTVDMRAVSETQPLASEKDAQPP